MRGKINFALKRAKEKIDFHTGYCVTRKCVSPCKVLVRSIRCDAWVYTWMIKDSDFNYPLYISTRTHTQATFSIMTFAFMIFLSSTRQILANEITGIVYLISTEMCANDGT